MNEESQRKIDALADLVWYLRGYIDASEHAMSDSPFAKRHIEALNEASKALANKLHEDDA